MLISVYIVYDQDYDLNPVVKVFDNRIDAEWYILSNPDSYDDLQLKTSICELTFKENKVESIN